MPIRISFPKFRARTKKACDIIMNSAREHRIHNIGFRFITSRIIYIAGSISTRVQVPKKLVGRTCILSRWTLTDTHDLGGWRFTWFGLIKEAMRNLRWYQSHTKIQCVKDSLILIQMINKWTASPIHKISSVLGKSSSWGGRVEDKAKAKKRDNVAECM